MSGADPLPVSAFVERALYAPGVGFYERGGRAGRRGDFVTSPEVGPLFGAVVAAALDRWWDEQGRPDPFVVHEHGAGPGTLARGVVKAGPACAAALRWVLVERSASQRALHADHLPHVGALDAAVASRGWGGVGEGPAVASAGVRPPGRAHVVLANELLDNLPFDLAERAARGWDEVRLAPSADGRAWTEVRVPLDPARSALLARLAPDAAEGARAPLQGPAAAWVRDSLAQLAPDGRLVVIDYAATTAALAARPWHEWVRTYRGHGRGVGPWEVPGEQDVTVEVAIDQVAAARPPDQVRSQAEALHAWGVEPLVAEAREAWASGAPARDLDALRLRSRVAEAEVLLDPGGLGAFTVAEWHGGR